MNEVTIFSQLKLNGEVITEGTMESLHNQIMKISSMLPEECQSSFYLTTVHGLSDRETAEFLRCPAEKVRELMEGAIIWIRTNIHKVREELQNIEEDMDYQSSN